MTFFSQKTWLAWKLKHVLLPRLGVFRPLLAIQLAIKQGITPDKNITDSSSIPHQQPGSISLSVRA
jgi:hypothetical protein